LFRCLLDSRCTHFTGQFETTAATSVAAAATSAAAAISPQQQQHQPNSDNLQRFWHLGPRYKRYRVSTVATDFAPV